MLSFWAAGMSASEHKVHCDPRYSVHASLCRLHLYVLIVPVNSSRKTVQIRARSPSLSPIDFGILCFHFQSLQGVLNFHLNFLLLLVFVQKSTVQFRKVLLSFIYFMIYLTEFFQYLGVLFCFQMTYL